MNKDYIIDNENKTITVQYDMTDDYFMALIEKYPNYNIQYGILR